MTHNPNEEILNVDCESCASNTESTKQRTVEPANPANTVTSKKPCGKRCKYIYALCGIGVALFVLVWFLFFSSFANPQTPQYIYIDTDDTVDSVHAKLEQVVCPTQMTGFKILCALASYGDNVKPGCYEISAGLSTFNLFRNIKNGNQVPIRLTVGSTWTKEHLADDVAQKLMNDSAAFASAMNNMSLCRQYGFDTCTITSIFIPNTYEVYWTITPEKFLERMIRESQAFWNEQRIAKAQALNMTQNEVMTLASIVDGETANNAEKPMIAGLYLNRLRMGMPLQSDPTVKYALGNFSLRRIYASMLRTQSPYNTYLNKGLPPSPIRIPQVSSIDAVLNPVHHNYIFMCAKEDFSGTHNFAATYAEHLGNARRYAAALNARNIQ